MIAARIDRRVRRDRAEERHRDPRQEVGRHVDQLERDRVAADLDARHMLCPARPRSPSAPAMSLTKDAAGDCIFGFSTRSTANRNVSGVTSSVDGGENLKPGLDRERVGLAVRRHLGHRLGRLRHQLAASRCRRRRDSSAASGRSSTRTATRSGSRRARDRRSRCRRRAAPAGCRPQCRSARTFRHLRYRCYHCRRHRPRRASSSRRAAPPAIATQTVFSTLSLRFRRGCPCSTRSHGDRGSPHGCVRRWSDDDGRQEVRRRPACG